MKNHKKQLINQLINSEIPLLSIQNNLIKVIGLMIKLRNFWVALAIGCAFSMGTTSCGDDDDEDDDDYDEDDDEDDR